MQALVALEENCEMFQENFGYLAKTCLEREVLLFPYQPKTHMVDHMILDFACQSNPRMTHCYADEAWKRTQIPKSTCLT